MLKSPFKVYQDFLSPKLCDCILESVKIDTPDIDANGIPVKMMRYNDNAENIIFDKFKDIVPALEKHYGFKYVGTEHPVFQIYPEGMNGPAERPGCRSSNFVKRKWVKTRNVDLTAVIWLKDFQNKTPIDTRSEVYGGKLEFPGYDFSLVPQRGTMIVYPAGPHFIDAVSPVMVGDLYQIRIDVAVENGWLYQPSNFQGTWQEWFKEYE